MTALFSDRLTLQWCWGKNKFMTSPYIYSHPSGHIWTLCNQQVFTIVAVTHGIRIAIGLPYFRYGFQQAEFNGETVKSQVAFI